jgi:hypothetical protein
MQLIDIDKVRYRKHLNLVIVSCIAGLTAGSLAIAQLLIVFFPDPSGSHFHWNLLGVVITSLTILWVLNRYKTHDFMIEVAYVWDLKQTLNKINRKMPKLQKASKKGNVEAILALHYSYAGSRLLWQLDDNTIVMDELSMQQAQLDTLTANLNLQINVDDFEPTMLAQF